MRVKSQTLLGLLSLVALTGAKLKWKCELFDTSQESSTKATTFVEYVKGKSPEPVEPNDSTPKNPRTPRSTKNPKCRPRPKNGSAPITTETDKTVIQKNRQVIQSDVPGSSIVGGEEPSSVRYQRKETHQNLDLNIGPGFEESNDPYGRSKQPVPKRFRPAELKGADELDKPLTEHLDENVMPDFEFDEEDAPPIQPDLPWCPEEEDCETADLEGMSIQELVEFKERCESTVSSERNKLIAKLIKMERGQPETVPTDRTAVLPPTGSTNCSTNPSELSPATLEKYRKECPCEDSTEKMTSEEFEIFKKECLDPIEEPGKPQKLIRKNGRCGASKEKIDKMGEEEYKQFVKECYVEPKNVVLKKILIVEKAPECKDVDVKKMGKKEFSKYQKKCVTSKNCDDVDKSNMDEKELTRFKKICSPSISRKTKSICDEQNPDELDDEQFEKFKIECILDEDDNDCSSVDVDSLSDSEYKKYRLKCQKTVPPMDCEKTDVKSLSGKELKEYNRLCKEPPMNCKSINPDELTDEEYERFKKECHRKSASDCAKINPKELSEAEYTKYEEECLLAEMNCTTADSREMTKKQYKKYEKACLKRSPDCQNVKVKKLSDEEYEKFQKNCLKEPKKFDCENVNVDELTDKEYLEYQKECINRENDFDCDIINPRKLSGKKLRKFQEECFKDTPDCTNLKIEELSDKENEDYEKKCLKKRDEEFDCQSVKPGELSKKKYTKFMRKCIKKSEDCENVKWYQLSDEEYDRYKKNCLKNEDGSDCLNGKVDKWNKEEYSQYKADCLDKYGNLDCDPINPKKLTRKQYQKYAKDCLTWKNTDDCKSVNPDVLTDEEYENYKMDCLMKKNLEFNDCDNVDVKKMNEKEYKEYEEDCLNEQDKSDCKNTKIQEMTDKEFENYEEDCLSRGMKSKDCDRINPDKLSDEEYKKYQRACPPKRSGRKPDCKNIDPKSLSDEEYSKYKKDCLDSSRSSSDCDSVNPEELSKKEYKKYNKDCLTTRKSTPDCENVNVEEMSDEEFSKYKKKCSSPPSSPSAPGDNVEVTKTVKIDNPEGGASPPKDTVTLVKKVIINGKPDKPSNENCKDADLDKMTDYEYNQYKKYCKLNFEGQDCDDVRTDKLEDEKLKEYVEKCGLFCGIDRKGVLGKKQRKIYEEKCEGDTNELEKNCKDIVVEKLGERMYGDFAEKCLEPINACSMLKSRRLVRKVYNEYRLKCKPRLRPSENSKCDVDTEKMTLEEYKEHQRKCGGCDDVTVEELSEQEYSEYKLRCEIDQNSEECKDIKVDELSREEYKKYLKKCGRRRPDSESETDEDCDSEDLDGMSHEEFIANSRRCRYTPDSINKYCQNIDWSSLKKSEKADLKKACENSKDRTMPPNGGSNNCTTVDTKKMTEEELRKYKKECGTVRKTPNNGPDYPESREDCHTVKIEELTSDEYLAYKKRCLSPRDRTPERKTPKSSETPDESPESPESPERRRPGDSVTIQKTVKINKSPKDESEPKNPRHPENSEEPERKSSRPKNPDESPESPDVTVEKTVKVNNPQKPDGCSNVNIAKLSDDEYDAYAIKCMRIRKTSKPDCENVHVKELTERELEEYKKNCPEEEEYEGVPPSRPSQMKCSDVMVEDLDREEFLAYKKRCGTPKRPRGSTPESPDDKDSDDCSNVNVEELSSEEYLSYKKRCLKNRPRRNRPIDENCSQIDTSALSEKEYRAYIRRCPESEDVKVQKTVKIDNCQNAKTDGMTKEEYARFKKECSRKPTIELTKTVKIIEGPKKPEDSEDECDRNVNDMTDEEFQKFQKKCGDFKNTFQFNCNSDVSKMTDLEFKKFRKACSKKPFDCETTDVDSLSERDYIRFEKECGKKNDCKDAKVENMSAKQYEEYRKKCKKTTTKTSEKDDCEDVKVEELNKEEYTLYKSRCLPPTPSPEDSAPPPKKIRKRIDCSIVDESMMSDEEYADFKKHCNVKVTTDRYRPGENIILTKKVKIRTGKEKFSCYDQDVDNMSEEEYAEFEKKCLSNPHFRFDCRTVDTSELSREEYSKYQRECQQKPQSIVLVKKLVVNKTNEAVKDGCYNRDVNKMTDEEYGQYEIKCLGREPTVIPSKPERKSSFDCHNVDLSQLSVDEIEEHIKRCRTRETATPPPTSPPPRRQSLKCSDVKTDDLDDAAYEKWVKECLETSPKTIQLEKKLIINTTVPLLSGKETVIVEKFEIHEHLRPDDDEGDFEGNEDFGVRVLTGIRKKVIKGRPDDDSESEAGVVLVKKVIHRIPGRRRPAGGDDDNDESGVIEVKKLIMKTSQPEPETDDSEDVEEIMRRPRKRVDPKEEVVLISVNKKHPHSYRKKSGPEEEEPTETVKLVKNTKHPNATLREVRIRKHFGTDVEEDARIQEIEGQDFKITKKTVMRPKKIRKMKSTTTTTTTPAEPEYYYDEEEVPEIITLVKVEKSTRPLRKHARPEDEDDEFVDVKEDKPKSYIEFEGYVKVRGAPRKLRKKSLFTDSGEEPDIREVTRKVEQGVEEDDFKGVKLRSHRKKLTLIRKLIVEEEPEDHEVTKVKKLKVLKFGNEEKENFDEDENVEDDGQVVVKNRRRKYISDRNRPGEDEEDEEYVNKKVAVRGRAPKSFRWGSHLERKGARKPDETNDQFYRIGGSPDESEEVEKNIRKNKYEESSEESRRRRKPSPGEDVIIKKIYRIGDKPRPDSSKKRDNSEKVILTKKKVFKYGSDRSEEVPEDEDKNEEIKVLKRKKFYRYGGDRPDESEEEPSRRKGEDEDEAVKVTKRKSFQIGKDQGQDQDGDEEIKLLKRKKFYRIGKDGKRELIRTEGDPEPGDDDESVRISKKKVYRIGKDGKRELVDEDEDQPGRKRQIARDQPGEDQDEQVMTRKHKLGGDDGPEKEIPGNDQSEEIIKMKKKKRFYRIGPDGKRELKTRGTEDGMPDQDDDPRKPRRQLASDLPGEDTSGEMMIKKQRGPQKDLPGEDQSGENQMMVKKHRSGSPQNDLPDEDEEIIKMKKKKRFYRIGPDGKRELIRTEGGMPDQDDDPRKPRRTITGEHPGEDEQVMTRKHKLRGGDGEDENVPDDDQDEKITMKKKKRFYRIGPDGKRELIRTEGGVKEDGAMLKMKDRTPLGQAESSSGGNDMDHEEIIKMKKKKRFYRIGPDGKRELIRTEGGGMPDQDDDPRKPRRKMMEEGEDGGQSGGMMTHKKSGILGKNKNTWSQEPLADDVNDQDGEMTHKKKRFYKIGPNGKRQLIRTEGDEPVQEDGGSSQEQTIPGKKTKRFYKIGSDGKRELIRTEGGDQSENPVSEDVRPPGGRLSVPDEPEEKKMGKRLQREQGQDDEDPNMDLGKLLRPKRKTSEGDVKHKEEPLIGSSRPKGDSGSPQKYHKDENLRTSGKSEEDIPEETR